MVLEMIIFPIANSILQAQNDIVSISSENYQYPSINSTASITIMEESLVIKLNQYISLEETIMWFTFPMYPNLYNKVPVHGAMPLSYLSFFL